MKDTIHLYTIGYEGRTIKDFITALEDKKIRVLVDVRDYPFSRKPDFRQTRLSQVLENNGIHYLHYKSLGAPKPIRTKFKETGNLETFTKEYSAHLAEQDTELWELYSTALDDTSCILCFEKDAHLCHRSILGEKLGKLNGHKVAIEHI